VAVGDGVGEGEAVAVGASEGIAEGRPEAWGEIEGWKVGAGEGLPGETGFRGESQPAVKRGIAKQARRILFMTGALSESPSAKRGGWPAWRVSGKRPCFRAKDENLVTLKILDGF
jgi:hypothetical protein